MAEPTIEHEIPSKQRHYAGSLLELARNLVRREIGFCTDDYRCYIKVRDSDQPEDLIPLGGGGSIPQPPEGQISLLIGLPDSTSSWTKLETKKLGSGGTQSGDLWYKLDGVRFAAQRAEKDYQGRDIQAKLGDGIGIHVDQDNLEVNLTERSIFQPHAAEARYGALRIEESDDTTKYQVHVGQSGALGALVPIVGSGKRGWILKSVSASGEIAWAEPSSLLRSDGSIDINNATDGDVLVVALTLPHIVPAGKYAKVIVDDRGRVTGHEDLLPTDIPDLDAAKIASGEFGTDRIADEAVTAEKLADNAVAARAIQDGVVSHSKMASGSVKAFALDTDAVETDKIKDKNVTKQKLADHIVGIDQIDLGDVMPFMADLGVSVDMVGGMLCIASRLYVGIAVLTITGSLTHTSPTQDTSYALISDAFSDGTTTRDNEFDVTYREVPQHLSIEGKPEFSVDSLTGHLIVSGLGALQSALNFDTVVCISAKAGYDFTGTAQWSDSAASKNYTQLIGALRRNILCAGGNADYIMSVKPLITAGNVSEISTTYTITMTASYLYASEA